MSRSVTGTLKAEARVLVSDGAWGTLLHNQGLRPGQCPELWCVERPDAVRGIAETYLAAGAGMVKTNSFGANRFKLAHYGLEGRCAELNRAAAALSRRAAGDTAFVIASAGPTGRILLAGDASPEDIYEAFREQAVALEEGGADALLVETMSAVDEAALAIRAARENTALEVLCTFTFQKTARGDFRTMMGVSPAQAARAALQAGAHIVGSNCGNGMEQMIEIVREIRGAAPDAPVAVHANAGAPASVGGKDVFPETPSQTASFVPELVEAGANIVGGCCGTTPDHIRAIAAAVRETRRRKQ
jgi:5-methyltetrahydrofolate--homocysteine methyltransferase